jgi:hypothetical protein
MHKAALITWLVTALGGFVMVVRWFGVTRTAPVTGSADQDPAERHVPVRLVLGRGLLAVVTVVLVLLSALKVGDS